MPVNSRHAQYDAALPAWQRARDVLAGEDAVKAAGEKYLPRMDSQTEGDYAVYRVRASLFGATSRTLEEYLDLVFRRAPVVALDSGEKLKGFVADCDLWGMDLVRYARQVVREVLAVGRAGSLVLWDEDAARSRVSLWRAEDVLNWDVERASDGVKLSLVVLADGKQRRVLRLVDGVCVQEFWESGESGWMLREQSTLKRDGVPLNFIPFVFHGPKHSRPEPQNLPLAEIIAANLDHYRLDADYKHGLHLAALPTAWVAGFEKNAELRIGSRTAWVSDSAGASAGFLEFKGAGLAQLERALDKVERRMALLGARMLEGSSVPGTGEQAAGNGAQLCGLASIVASLNQSVSRVLELALWWVDGGDVNAMGGRATFTMNTDLGARALSGEEITAVVAAWRSGAISRETMLERLKRGELLPEGRTVTQERELIHGRTK